MSVLKVSVLGAVLAVETTGDGPPLVLVHGFTGNRRLWDALWPALGAGRRLVRYDLRGHGQSEEPQPAPYRHPRDLAALLDALGVEACDLVGVSMGGAIALSFALDYPLRVRRLVLASPGIAGWEWSDGWRALWRPIAHAAQAGDLARARELWFEHPLFAATRALPAAAAKLRASIAAYSGAHWAEGDREEPVLPDLDRVSDLAPPTLLLTGTEDLADFRLIADLIAAAAPAVRRIDYPGAGHLVNLERPKAFAADIAAFLEATPA